MASDPFKYFRLEGRELIDQLDAGVLQLERGELDGVVPRMLRHAHTLKGAARVVRLPRIADLAHALEDALAPLRTAESAPARYALAPLLVLLEQLRAALAEVAAAPAGESPSPIPPPARPSPPAPAPPSSPPSASTPASPPRAGDAPIHSVRTELAELDVLLDGVMQSTARLGALRGATDDVEAARQLAEVVATQLAPRGATVGSRHDREAQRLHALALQLRDLLRGTERRLHLGFEQVERELAQVRDAAEHVRLVPAGTMFSVLERTARDAAHVLGKQVEVIARGGELRLDANVLVTVQGALLQLVRNAVAHGIESPGARHGVGKPERGRLVIDVEKRGRRIAFRCSDDGRGLDLDAVRAVAREHGATAADVEHLSADELVELLLRGGISTSPRVTQVAGRGVGLDVVRAAAAQLGGAVTVETQPGAHTAFELVVPVSLASLEALVVKAEGTTATIALDRVRATRRVAAAEIARTASGESIAVDGAAVPLVRLAALFPAEPARAAHPRSPARSVIAVVVEAGGGRAALAIDTLAGTTTVVARPVPELAGVDPIVEGIWLDAHGDPQPLLDAERVVAAACAGGPAAVVAAPARRSVLVIDDSLTTRMLEQSILESAGYDVDTACSAEEGLEAARRKRYALFLVDVEMPGIDGFTFVERTRADPDLRATPAILVTSRNSPADLRRGEEVGARGYIVKSEFDQVDLLARIDRMVS
jgi:two-component system, chemotaxis family, sensor kinase CheA